MTKPGTIYDLLSYQKALLADTSRYRLGLWSRQTGKSFTTALDAVLDCIATPNTLWVCLSAGERQSLEWMEKAKLHCEAAGVAAELVGDRIDADIARLTIRFANGSRIVGLPARPQTARGYSGNVILDEFAFHEDSRAIWRALMPTITRGYRLTVLSTPNGQGNMFHALATGPDGAAFTKHKVTIEDAAAAGLAVNIDELREAIDPDGWRQEYMCEFLDEAGSLLTYEMIERCEAAECPAAPGAGPLYLGMDIGRKRDLTAIWIVERVGDVYRTAALRILEKTPFREQLEVLSDYLRNPRVLRACIDSTGVGAMLAEEAQRTFGDYRVENVTFTMAVKSDLAMPMLAAFQDRAVRIPQSREIREDLHKIRKITTAAGNVRYLADRDEAGHADRFWALALALHAGKTDDGGPVFAGSAGSRGGGRGHHDGMHPDHDDDYAGTGTDGWGY